METSNRITPISCSLQLANFTASVFVTLESKAIHSPSKIPNWTLKSNSQKLIDNPFRREQKKDKDQSLALQIPRGSKASISPIRLFTTMGFSDIHVEYVKRIEA